MTSLSSPPSKPPLLPVIRTDAAPLRRQVLDDLRQSIIHGRLVPGSRLVERELITMMGVSRTVIREALRQLESEGLVTIIPNKGPVVRALSAAEAGDLYSIRAVLEGLAARRFAEKASPEQSTELESALYATANAYVRGNPEEILDCKNGFYEALFEGAGSETLSTMIGMLHVRIWRWRAMGLSHPRRSAGRWKESIEGLRAVLDAIRKRDPERAESLMRAEVTRAAAEAMQLLAGGDIS